VQGQRVVFIVKLWTDRACLLPGQCKEDRSKVIFDNAGYQSSIYLLILEAELKKMLTVQLTSLPPKTKSRNNELSSTKLHADFSFDLCNNTAYKTNEA